MTPYARCATDDRRIQGYTISFTSGMCSILGYASPPILATVPLYHFHI